MTNYNPTDNPAFNRKLERLNTLTDFVAKLEEAILGEEPQMRKEYIKLKKIAIKEMDSLNSELRQLASKTANKV